MQKSLVLVGIALAVAGCGTKEQKVVAPAPQATAPANAVSSASHDSEDEDETATHANPPDQGLTLVPLQHQGAIALQVLLPVPDPSPPPGFPTATADDKECVKAAGLTGRLERDFEELTNVCGKNTGMKEYAKSLVGPLNSGHKHEAFSVKLTGGYCYRFFAVADGSIEKLGIRVQRSNGALHSMIQGKQPVVIYRPNQVWCRRRDRDFQIVLESLGSGEGRYAFGVYARPSERGRVKE